MSDGEHRVRWVAAFWTVVLAVAVAGITILYMKGCN